MALGAVIGGLIGLITGDVIEKRQAAATPRTGAPPPPPPGQWSVVTAPAAAAHVGRARRKLGRP